TYRLTFASEASARLSCNVSRPRLRNLATSGASSPARARLICFIFRQGMRSRDYRRAASSRAQVAEWQNGFAGTANRDNCAVGPFQLAFNGGRLGSTCEKLAMSKCRPVFGGSRSLLLSFRCTLLSKSWERTGDALS